MISLKSMLTFILGFGVAHIISQHQNADTRVGQNDILNDNLRRFTTLDKCKGTLGSSEKNHTSFQQNGATIEKKPEVTDDRKSEVKFEKRSEVVHDEKAEVKPEVQTKVASSPSTNTNDNEPKTLFPKNHPCSHFGSSIPSTGSFWNKNLGTIFNATRYPEREKGETLFHDFTALLLHLMSSNRLQSSIKSLPSQYWDRVGEIMDVAHKRLEWVRSGKVIKPEPRRVYVLVLGGSVTMGMGCEINPVKSRYAAGPRNCSWAKRVREFFRDLLNTKEVVIDVRAMTIGGTNTDSATLMWDYSVFPSDVYWPDIIIHAYSTNDMHVLSEIQAKIMNITLDEMIMRVNEKFVRTVLSRHPRPPIGKHDVHCRPKTPLLLYFDDYIGNEQRGILDTMAFSKAITALSTYYGFGVISYANAVRDMVYSNINEIWFSPSNWPERNVHPGMGMHISSTWVIVFYFLNMATTYCGLPSTLTKSDGSLDKANESAFGYAAVNGMPELIGKKEVEQGPISRFQQLPPTLNTTLTLDNMSARWSDSEAAASLLPKDNLEACTDDVMLKFNRPCIYAWIAHLPKNPRKDFHVDKIMKPILKTNEGWKAVDDNGKVGFASEATNSTFVIEFPAIEKPVKAITFMIMTSYGEMWEGSEVSVDIYILRKGSKSESYIEIHESMNIQGYHDKKTSEIFPHTAMLDKNGAGGGRVGDTLRISIRHIGGKKFKIMGMAFCDR